MDALGEDYNHALQEMVAQLNAESKEDFIIIW